MHRIVFSIAAGLAAISAAAESPTRELLDRMMFHMQGWGTLGEDVHAHIQGQSAAPLQVGEKPYPHGLGMHAPHETVFALEGRYSAFDAEVGIQQQPSRKGSAEFIVLVDGAEAFRSGVLRGDSAPVPVHVDVTGAQELTLKATDGGDGITFDVTNWANATLIPNPNAAADAPREMLDIAPFAKVVTSDPARKTGSTHKRIEEFPADELFPETSPLVVPGDSVEAGPPVFTFEDGDVPVAIGLQWLERRRVGRLAIAFEGAAPDPRQVQLEEWDGPSRWQGRWIPVEATPTVDGNTFTYEVPPAAHATGALQYRWVLPDAAHPWRVEDLKAWSRSSTGEMTLQVEAVPSPSPPSSGERAGVRGRTFHIVGYNAKILEQESTTSVSWADGNPLRLQARYILPRTWQASDRSQLRFTTPDGHTTSIAMDTLLEQGRLYIPGAGLFITSPPGNVTLEQHLAEHKDQKTVLERVREMPDQTLEQAIKKVNRKDAKLGPTLLSLPADNRKFLLERDGSISWSNDPKKYDSFDTSVEQPFDHKLVVTYSERTDVGSRRISFDFPVLETTLLDPEFRATSLDNIVRSASAEVALFRSIELSPTREASPVTVTLRCTANLATGAAAKVVLKDDMATFEADGVTLVWVTVRPESGLELKTSEDAIQIAGVPGHLAVAGIVVPHSPRQGATLDHFLTMDPLVQVRQPWEAAFEQAAAITTPDTRLNDIIRASQVHCLIAARSDHEGNIAPWIGSVHYGPLESEGHAVIQGMMALGHQDFARRALNYYVERYNQQGFLTTGYTTMGTGWHLWTLGQYDDLYRDDDFIERVAPEVERVVAWVQAQREKTRAGGDVPEAGLMPPGPLADWDLWACYYYGNGNYAAGLRAASRALERVTGRASGMDDMHALLAKSLEQAAMHAPVVPLSNGVSVPFYPTHPYAPGPIGDLYPGEDGNRSWCYDVELGAPHLIAMGIIDPLSDAATHMMEYHEDEFYLRDGWISIYPEEENRKDWFNYGGFAKVQPYYARTGEIHALRDDVKPFLRTYFNSIASLLNPEDLSFWEHFFNGAYNKTHETGYFLYQTSLMLAQARGDALWIAPLIPEAWLRLNAAPLVVERLPTPFGRVSYSITSEAERVVVNITPSDREAVPMVLRLRGVLGVEGKTPTVTVSRGQAQHEIAGDTLRLQAAEAFELVVTR